MSRLSKKKNNIHIFHPASDQACFFLGRGELSCAIPYSAVWSLDRSRPHMIHILLLLISKIIWLNFESPQQILTNFQPVRFLLHRQVFRHQFCTNFPHVQMICQNSMNCIFIQARFFSNHPDTQSAVFRHHSSHHFHILIVCWRDWSSRTRIVFNIYSTLFERVLPLKNRSSR